VTQSLLPRRIHFEIDGHSNLYTYWVLVLRSASGQLGQSIWVDLEESTLSIGGERTQPGLKMVRCGVRLINLGEL
jgi:hypothetical protein